MKSGRALCGGLRVGSGVFDVDETEEPATTEAGIISRKFLPSGENDSDEFTIRPHPFLLVEADKARSGGVDGMILAHLYLWKNRGGLRGIGTSRIRIERAHVGPGGIVIHAGGQ